MTYLIEWLQILNKLPREKSLTQCLRHGMDLVFVDLLSEPSTSYPLYGEMRAMCRRENQSDHFSFTGFLLGVPCWLIAGAKGRTVLFLETCLLGSPCQGRSNHFAGVTLLKKPLGHLQENSNFISSTGTRVLRELCLDHFFSKLHSPDTGPYSKTCPFTWCAVPVDKASAAFVRTWPIQLLIIRAISFLLKPSRRFLLVVIVC